MPYERCQVILKCPQTGELFTTNELDAVNMAQVKKPVQMQAQHPQYLRNRLIIEYADLHRNLSKKQRLNINKLWQLYH